MSAQAEAELKAQWEAQNVFPQNYKNDLMAFLRTYLNDPTHVRGAAVSQPQRKNVGSGRTLCRLRALQRAQERRTNMPAQRKAPRFTCRASSTASSTRRREVREICKDAAYAPFPELETLTR